MITRISVQNYQSLRNIDIELGRVTVIVGHSDAGKSAFLRAVQALVYNQEGHEFIHRRLLPSGLTQLEEPASVSMFLAAGQTIVWRRYEKYQEYLLNKSDGTSQSFTKMGRGGVPPEIQQLLQIWPVLIEENKRERVHFSFQHDQPFLVGDRGGVGANRVLGRLTGLHVFANAAKQCNASKQSLASDLKTKQVQAASMKQQLAQFQDLTLRRQQLSFIQAQWQVLQGKEQHFQQLTLLLKTLMAQAAEYRALQKVAQIQSFVTMQHALLSLQKKTVLYTQLSARWEQAQVLTRNRDDLGVAYHRGMAELSAAQRALTAFVQEHPFCQACGQPLPGEQDAQSSISEGKLRTLSTNAPP